MNKNTKELLRDFFPLLLAIGLQQLITLTVNLVDNVMLGAYSETAMSGAAVVNQIQYMLQQVCSGVGAGVTVLGAQYWGKHQTEPIRKLIGIGLKISLCAGILFFVLTSLFPVQIIGIFTNQSIVAAASMEYLRIMRWTYLIYSMSAVLMFSLRSVQTAYIGTVMSASTICINLVLNYILIYGNFGAPELGIQGAAVATVISRSMELIIVVVYLLKADRKLMMKFRDLLSFDRSYFKDYVLVSLPVMITGSMWGVSQAAQSAILGHISAETIAANSVASVIFQLFTVFGFADANASSVVIGKTIGEGHMDRVIPYAKTLQKIYICMGIFFGGSFFLLRGAIVSLYNLTPATRSLTLTFMMILSISMIGSCYEYPVESGIIAGGGDTKYAAIVDNTFMWLYTIPFAAASAFLFRWAPAITFLILKSDQILKCIPNAIKCNRFRWIRNLTRQI